MWEWQVGAQAPLCAHTRASGVIVRDHGLLGGGSPGDMHPPLLSCVLPLLLGRKQPLTVQPWDRHGAHQGNGLLLALAVKWVGVGKSRESIIQLF